MALIWGWMPYSGLSCGNLNPFSKGIFCISGELTDTLACSGALYSMPAYLVGEGKAGGGEGRGGEGMVNLWTKNF